MEFSRQEYLLQGIFSTQGWNPGLLHYGQIIYHLSHQGNPLRKSVGQFLIAPERSENGAQLWICLVVKVQADAVKSAVA